MCEIDRMSYVKGDASGASTIFGLPYCTLNQNSLRNTMLPPTLCGGRPYIEL